MPKGEKAGTQLTKRDMKLGYGYISAKTLSGKVDDSYRYWYVWNPTTRLWTPIRSQFVPAAVKRAFPRRGAPAKSPGKRKSSKSPKRKSAKSPKRKSSKSPGKKRKGPSKKRAAAKTYRVYTVAELLERGSLVHGNLLKADTTHLLFRINNRNRFFKKVDKKLWRPVPAASVPDAFRKAALKQYRSMYGV